jgi:hypothetical protein
MTTEAEKLTALEVELRRDLAAIERVKKMMAFKNGNLGSALTVPKIPINQPPELQPSDLPEETLSLRGTIESILNADPSIRWTVQKVVQRLKDMNFDLKAQKPVFSVGQAMKKLADKGRIRLVKKGSGSEPHVYQGKSA